MKQTKPSLHTNDILGLQINEAYSAPKIYTSVIAHIHELYLVGELGDAEGYIEWFHLIRHANADDVIVIHINCPGGDGATAIQFMRVIQECEATVIASIEGDCMSAATMIALSCDQFIIADHSRFMVHNYSAMAMGKGNEMYDHITAERTWSEKLIKDSYQDFLTDSEILQVLEGKDFWLAKDDVLRRLERKKKATLKKIKSSRKKLKPKEEVTDDE